MRLQTLVQCTGALLASVTAVEANNRLQQRHELIHCQHRDQRSHQHSHSHNHTVEDSERHELRKRGTCAFPTNLGLIPVTPGAANGGWAMSPDQPCTAGNYCPYACPPGQVSMQWDPAAISYTYPLSMHGGLLCNSDGTVSKPFPNQPYCQATASNINVVNNAGGMVAVCQTVLPGNEAMLIPTEVDSTAVLANPDTTYWAGTAAHYYINPPGVSTTQGCVWGSTANPWGNWAPYVAGANMDASGNTFLKLGWNPIYLEPATPFRNTMPTWGASIQCPGGGCNGLPCAIDPTQNTVNTMNGSSSIGAGGAAFCVVTVPKGSTANIVISSASGSKLGGNTPAQAGALSAGQFYTNSLSGSSTSTARTTASSSTAAGTITWQGWSGNSTITQGSYSLQTPSATSTAGSIPTGTASGSASKAGSAVATSMVGSSSLQVKGGASKYGMSALGLALAVWTFV